MSASVQIPFAAALCALGTVFYAADAEAQQAATQIAEVPVRRFLRRRKLLLFRARSEREVLPAFESEIHNWSLNAQWLIVADPTGLEMDCLAPIVQTLYQDWRLPTSWPDAVLLIVQAGVDGDAAICHCKDDRVDQRLLGALRIAASESGFHFRLLDSDNGL